MAKVFADDVSLEYSAQGAYCILSTIAVEDSLTGNGNRRFDPGETAHLYASIRNIGTAGATNTTALLRSGDARFVPTDSVSSHGTIPAGSTSAGQPFTIAVDQAMPLETPVDLTVIVTADGYCDTFACEVVVGELNQYDPTPDGPRRPALYWAFDDVDALYRQHPVFNWVEINLTGASVRLPNDGNEWLYLPFNWQMYGRSENRITLSSNGWVCPGYSDVTSPDNTTLPGGPVPYMVCANWDDLNPEVHGCIYYQEDSLRHRVIIEWDSVAYAYNPSVWDKFQVILYDQTVPTPTGDNLIVIQYLTANGYTSSTVGIQDGDRTTGIGYLFDGAYHRAAAPIAAGRAVKFTTDTPSGVAEPRKPFAPAAGPAFSVAPNPMVDAATIRLAPTVRGPASLSIYNSAGELVERMDASRRTVSWRPQGLPAGVYLVRLSAQGLTETRRVALVR